jgi:uncharacterized membrane protein YecN with MAPEG domain
MSNFPIPITAVFAALLALMLVGISVRVTVLRTQKKVNLGDGGDAALGAAIRVQGNFVEYVPLALALMAMLEWMGVPAGWIYAFGAVLLVARLSHAWSLYSSVFQARVFGTTATWLLLAVGALAVLARVA